MLWNALSRRMPALLMTMSTLPNSSMAVCTMASPPSGVATESVLATATPPASSISSTTFWAGPASSPSTVDRTAEVVDHDLRAARGEQQCVLAAETAARAGDDRNLVVESDVSHGAGGYRWSARARKPGVVSVGAVELASGGHR